MPEEVLLLLHNGLALAKTLNDTSMNSARDTSPYAGLVKGQALGRALLRVWALAALLEVAYTPASVAEITWSTAALIAAVAALCLKPEPHTVVIGFIAGACLMQEPGAALRGPAAGELTIYAFLLLASASVSAVLWKKDRPEPAPANRLKLIWALGLVLAVSVAAPLAPLTGVPFETGTPLYTGETRILLVLGWATALAMFIVPYLVPALHRSTLGAGGAPNCRTTDVGLAALAGLLGTPFVLGMPEAGDSQLVPLIPAAACALMAFGLSFVPRVSDRMRTWGV